MGQPGTVPCFFFRLSHSLGCLWKKHQPGIGGLVSELQVIMVSLYTTVSGDSWMYPDPNVPLWEIPKLTPIFRGYQNGFFSSPRNPIRRTGQLNPMGTVHVR